MLGAVNNESLQNAINEESERYHDLVQGNFVDSYRNLTYKHVMGLKWITVRPCLIDGLVSAS